MFLMDYLWNRACSNKMNNGGEFLKIANWPLKCQNLDVSCNQHSVINESSKCKDPWFKSVCNWNPMRDRWPFGDLFWKGQMTTFMGNFSYSWRMIINGFIAFQCSSHGGKLCFCVWALYICMCVIFSHSPL